MKLNREKNVKAGHVALLFQKQCWKSHHHLKPNKTCMCLTVARNLLASLVSLPYYYFFPASVVFDTELHVCLQRITSVLFYEIHIVWLLFNTSSVWVLLLCVILAAEGSRAVELCSVSSLFRRRKLFMGWNLILQLDFITKLDLTVLWKSHYFSRGFCE